MNDNAKYFVPIFRAPHSRFRSRIGLVDLFKSLVLSDHDHLIVIDDRPAEDVQAGREAEILRQVIGHTARGFQAGDRGWTATWNEIAGLDDFVAFAPTLRDALRRSPVWPEVRSDAQRRISPRTTLDLDHAIDDVLSDICMIVFCTEILGYRSEVRERPPRPSLPDPLHLLYAKHRNVIAQTTARLPARTVVHLYEARSDALVSPLPRPSGFRRAEPQPPQVRGEEEPRVAAVE